MSLQIDNLISAYPTFKHLLLAVIQEVLLGEARESDPLRHEDLIWFIWSRHSDADFEHARRLHEPIPDALNENADAEIEAEIATALSATYGQPYIDWVAQHAV